MTIQRGWNGIPMTNLQAMEKLLNICAAITAMRLSIADLFEYHYFDAWVTCSHLALKVFDESITNPLSGAKGGM